MLRAVETIYLDNAASTRPYPCVIKAMSEAAGECYANPSALHIEGVKAREAIEEARQTIADTINADADEIYFTSGATEANNWSKHIIRDNRYFYCSEIEHKSVLEHSLPANRILVKEEGVVSVGGLGTMLDKRGNSLVTPMISIMWVNNETGVMQPIDQMVRVAQEYNGIFHTDATQAYGKIPIDVKKVPVDLLSASGHKIYGPRGVGFLYISNQLKDKIFISPFIRGGGQENGLRSGTENLPAIVGMAIAAKECVKNMKNDQAAIHTLRERLYHSIIDTIPHCGSNIIRPEKQVSNFLNMYFEGVDSQELVVLLGERGVCVSSGSACNAGNNTPSHVLKAMKVREERLNSSVRFSLSHDTTKTEIDKAVKILKNCVESLRMFQD